ncbi:UDP-glucoronosyl and UDP-glucosyl transferase [Aspergillus ellipticus CBS 707.79]|uniref:UDP-glucoronosyl and UDP-glucosyl transferase n=1 Tax=Aspergillus ellipticus CBS 707.79 TaxID=1448320 RepID=A0A319D7U9_9EURO|nr:UDP-glucoronosyl and UDP-glucosyl transferase [Aspergillus ellipticus CBS 707.79]
MSDTATPPRKILLVVTGGGYTHAAPILELGKILANRSHVVDFATLEGQEKWGNGFQISTTHVMGPGPTEEQLDAHYKRSRLWDPSKGLNDVMDSKYLFDSLWTQTYHHLKKIMADPATRPDMMVADFFVDAVKDMQLEYKVPIAIVWPQMPYLMVPCSYIPGHPGFQLDMTLTSENASMWSRISNELVLLWALPNVLKLWNFTKAMRKRVGLNYLLPTPQKPDYLLLINSFFGLEVPKDLPPLVSAVGPILADEYPPLDDSYQEFLTSHPKTIYVALGTHIILPHADARKIVQGLVHAMDDGLIDGVIWSVGKSGRQLFDKTESFTLKGQTILFGDLLDGEDNNWIFPFFAPQRAILDHPHTRIYFTHGGGSSANEGLYHGKPMLVMSFFFDQIGNAAKLAGNGTSELLHKFRFTADELYTKMRLILEDRDGSYARNVQRLQRIAHVASRRKYLGADLIEEVLYDTESRVVDGKETRAMHLQTADMRMPAYKAKNWDMMAVSGLVMGLLGSGTYYAARFAWTQRQAIRGVVDGLIQRIRG